MWKCFMIIWTYQVKWYDKQVEETRLTNKHTDAKRERSNNGGSFKGKHQIQDKPTFKKRFSNQVS